MTDMYMQDDTMTPRDRISEDMLRRMLGGEALGNQGSRQMPDSRTEHINCRGERENGSGGCGKGERENTNGLSGYPLASVYAPLQHFRKLYDLDTALIKGTVFSELDLPFMGASVSNDKGGCCRD